MEWWWRKWRLWFTVKASPATTPIKQGTGRPRGRPRGSGVGRRPRGRGSVQKALGAAEAAAAAAVYGPGGECTALFWLLWLGQARFRFCKRVVWVDYADLCPDQADLLFKLCHLWHDLYDWALSRQHNVTLIMKWWTDLHSLVSWLHN
jgi:hypothetical protein